MSQFKSPFGHLCSALIIAGGFGMLWGATFSLAVEMIGTKRPADWATEWIRVSPDGTPVIEAHRRRGRREFSSYRALDGTPLEPDQVTWWWPTNLAYVKQSLPRRLAWRSRILSWSKSGQESAELWYLIHDTHTDERAYFVGYDWRTKYRVGFIGQFGFRKTRPPESDRFPVLLDHRSLDQSITWANQFVWRYEPSANATWADDHIVPQSTVPQWSLHLISGRQVVRIDLGARTAQVVMEADDALSVAVEQPRPDVNRRHVENVVVRRSDRAIIIKPDGTEVATFQLPAELRELGRFSFYRLQNDLALIDAPVDRSQVVQTEVRHLIRWIGPSGRVLRRKDVSLRTSQTQILHLVAFADAGMTPAPAVLTFHVVSVDPGCILDAGIARSYSAALAPSLSHAWPALLATYVISAVLSWFCWRRHGRYAANGRRAWALFVFLLGAPGLIGYLFHRRWPVLEACPHCEQVVPRDRDICTACGQMFPEPKRKGCEIYA